MDVMRQVHVKATIVDKVVATNLTQTSHYACTATVTADIVTVCPETHRNLVCEHLVSNTISRWYQKIWYYRSWPSQRTSQQYEFPLHYRGRFILSIHAPLEVLAMELRSAPV